MKHYGPRQIKESGKWHFTCHEKEFNAIYPVGYCTSEIQSIRFCEGHDSPKEAWDHYKKFLLDRMVFRWGEEQGVCRSCCVEGCDSFTKGYLSTLTEHDFKYYVCSEHATREVLLSFLKVEDLNV